jgi:hypothetical protein
MQRTDEQHGCITVIMMCLSVARPYCQVMPHVPTRCPAKDLPEQRQAGEGGRIAYQDETLVRDLGIVEDCR